MGRKRALKKKLKKRGDRLSDLETLFVSGKDDEFLRIVAQVVDLAHAGMESAYLEVLERSLLRRLRKVDIEGVRDSLAQARPEAKDLPVVRLARAVVAIDRGELSEAQEALAALEGQGQSSSMPPTLVRRLQVLAGSNPESICRAKGEPPRLADFAKLQRSLSRWSSGKIQRLPGKLALDWGSARDAFSFAQALTVLGDRAAPSPSELARALGRLASVTESLAVDRFWDGAPRELLAAARRLADSRYFLEEMEHFMSPESLDENRDRLSELAGSNLPDPLARLQYFITLYVRSCLVDLVTEHGPGSLSRAWAACDEAMDPFFEVTPNGDEEALGTTRKAHALYERCDLLDLASLLRRESSSTGDLHRLGRLWGLDLAVLWGAARAEEGSFTAFILPEEKDQRALGRLLSRLRAMVRELPQLSVTDGCRIRFATLLAGELHELAADLEATTGLLPVALQLLEYLPERPELLILALDKAYQGGKARVVLELEERIEARGPVAESEVAAIIERLRDPSPFEVAEVARLFASARPLLGKHWGEAGRRLFGFFEHHAMGIVEMLVEHRRECCEEGATAGLSRLRGELEIFDPLFGTLPEYEVAELMIARVFVGTSTIPQKIDEILEHHEELETALAVLWWAREFEQIGIDVGTARSTAELALVMRLDPRWHLWSSLFSEALYRVDVGTVALAESRLETLLADSSLDEHDRAHLEMILEDIVDRLLELQPRPKRRKKKRPGPKRKTRATPSKPDPQMELF